MIDLRLTSLAGIPPNPAEARALRIAGACGAVCLAVVAIAMRLSMLGYSLTG